jgi:hypothetical protein
MSKFEFCCRRGTGLVDREGGVRRKQVNKQHLPFNSWLALPKMLMVLV